jgi:site-specific DNA recombinase
LIAGHLEEVVWTKVREVLENPEVILAELKREQVEARQSGAPEKPSLDRDIAELKRRIRACDAQERRLVQLFRYGEIDTDAILDELNQLKKDRQGDGQLLQEQLATKERLAALDNAEIKLSAYCERVRPNLANCSYGSRRLALEALGIQVKYTPGTVEIRGVIPINTTSGRDAA